MAEEIGGLQATVSFVSAADFDAQRARVLAALDSLEAKTVEASATGVSAWGRFKKEMRDVADHIERGGVTSVTGTTRIDAGMKQATKGASGLGYQLQMIGALADDMQYVGEQGLRPILNNLMMIHPAVGLVAIAFDQARKNGGMWTDVGKSIIQLMAALVDQDIDLDTTEGVSALGRLKDAAMVVVDYVSRIPEAFGELSGWTARAEDRANKVFEETADVAADKERGKAVAEAITAYGPRKFLGEMIDPALREPGNEDILRQETTSLRQLVERAKGGDRAATAELEERTAGKGVGEAIRGNLPGAKEGRKAEEEQNRKDQDARVKKWKEDMEAEGRARAKYQADLAEGQAAEEKENEANYETYRKDRETERGKTFEELEVMREMEEFDESEMATAMSPKQREKQASLEERGSDLDWKLQQLIMPERVGKSMGGDEYESSFKSTTGMDEQLKRLHAIWEVNKDISKNTEALRNLRTPVVKKR